ncbi:WxL domain-containing protein [Carnobacterium gallinarum]|uniref:WxL domain-containing protein n=1 Tax=Carnobacterium gallinarum TaxID=2749 RepID=UPI000553A3BE|nr:WxL domain-containing protein [Carnobacterium gallinarum]
MKLTKVTLVSMITFGAVLVMATPVLAADPVPVITDSKVMFEEGSVNPDGGLTKPDDKDKDIILPQPPIGGENGLPDGNGNLKPTGSLAITFAPTIDFGKVKIKTGGAVYASNTMQYKNVTTATDAYMPNMLTVEDVRGTKAGWTVSVQGSEFKTSAADGDKKLEGAYLTFSTGRKVYNDAENGPAAINDPAKFDTKDELVLSPGTNGTYAALPLLTAQAGNGTALTAVVFDKNYEGTFSNPTTPTAYDSNTKINDITLTVPANAVPQANVSYVSKVTWTLSTTP